MEHLQTLLLLLLLVMSPPVNTNYSWSRREGGGEAKIPSMPYMAYLQGKNNHSCTGFLVAPNWVMTAAQCFVHRPLTVTLGAHTVHRKEKSWQQFEVKAYHPYPRFISREKGRDILLLKLKDNARSNRYVRTISLEKFRIPGGTVCSVANYKTSTGTLRVATVNIIRPRECLAHYPGLPENVICGRSSSAEDNVGAPLVCNNKAYGIFSYRVNNWPSFYTHISPYLVWISKVMKSA